MKPFEGMLKLTFEDSNNSAGIVNMPVLAALLEKCAVELVGTLTIPEPRKNIKPQDSEGPSVRIVVYGRQEERNTVATSLSDSGVYFQHPTATEVDPEVPYFNPHYLLRPGSQMPRLEELTLSDEGESRATSEALDETRKSEIMRIFDSANAGIGACSPEPSPRLLTTLKE